MQVLPEQGDYGAEAVVNNLSFGGGDLHLLIRWPLAAYLICLDFSFYFLLCHVGSMYISHRMAEGERNRDKGRKWPIFHNW